LRRPEHEAVTLALEPRASGNDLVMLNQMARDGLGIVSLPAYICRGHVAAGALVPVLADWRSGEANITAVIPFRHGLLPSVRAFVDFLVEEVPKVVG